MKYFLLSLISIYMLCATSFAQNKKNLDHHGHQHDNHSEYIEETVDPFGNPVKMYTDPRVENDTEEFDPPLLTMQEFYELQAEAEDRAYKNAVAPTRVYLVADTEYIAAHGGNWLNRILTIFNSARVSFAAWHGIELIPVGFLVWDSNGTTNSAILSDLASDFSHITDRLHR